MIDARNLRVDYSAMPMLSDARPRCHLGHTASHGARLGQFVWICEYPYRTMRLEGPSSDCHDCPVWREIEAARVATALKNGLDVVTWR